MHLILSRFFVRRTRFAPEMDGRTDGRDGRTSCNVFFTFRAGDGRTVEMDGCLAMSFSRFALEMDGR